MFPLLLGSSETGIHHLTPSLLPEDTAPRPRRGTPKLTLGISPPPRFTTCRVMLARGQTGPECDETCLPSPHLDICREAAPRAWLHSGKEVSPGL